MTHSELLQNWLIDNSIKHTFVDNDKRIVEIDNEKYLLLTHKSRQLLGENSLLILSEDELDLIDDYEPSFFIALFGSVFYYFDDSCIETKEIYDEFGEKEGEESRVQKMHILRYIGKCEPQFNFPVLGVHGGYDICNGTKSYKDWVKKAKWLDIEILGICEENTLAGTLLFQDTCQKNNIKSIIGETIVVQYDSSLQYHIKLYVTNDVGWRNLLQINALINISKLKSIELSELKKYSEGLICVLTPTIGLELIYNSSFEENFGGFMKVFYQLDFVEWQNTVKEEEWIDNLFLYLRDYRDKIAPLALYDMYYLEQQDNVIQPVLWRIGKRSSFKYRSADRYFKTCNQYLTQAAKLFDDDKQYIIDRAADNLDIFKEIDFTIPVGEKYLPQYELTDEQKQMFSNSEELFWHLIQEGLESKVIDRDLDPEVYIARIQEEVRVIELGQVRDYFLIVWDILNFARSQNIIVGLGRGSAAGCLVSYLLGIVQIDPIEYDLLFERFLNEGRMGKPTEVEYLQVQTDEGDIEIDLEKTITILRDRKEIVILAKELQDGDEILQYM